ncbi:hypothetical protein HDU88_008736 [Geranomyces variabilis]|nr:hypothetical protein HDU88_008736 [Geranomyces variabilis]
MGCILPLSVAQAKWTFRIVLGTIWGLYVTSSIYSYARQGTVISTSYDSDKWLFPMPLQGNSATPPTLGYLWVPDTTNYAGAVSVEAGASAEPLQSHFSASQVVKPCPLNAEIACTYAQLVPTEAAKTLKTPFQLMIYAPSQITLSVQASLFGTRYIDPDFAEYTVFPSLDPESLLNIPRLATRPNFLQASAGGVGNVQNLQLALVKYTEYPGPWASFWPGIISRRIRTPRSEYFYQLFSTSSFTGLNVERGNNGNLTAIILNSGPRFTTVQNEIGTIKGTDVINSISAPFGPIVSLMTLCFGLGIYRAHGILQRHFLDPRKWAREQYSIVSSSVSSIETVTLTELEERVRAMENFRDLLRSEIVYLEKDLLGRPLQGAAHIHQRKFS